MERLFEINGWAETEADLQKYNPKNGETVIINVVGEPFDTYMICGDDDMGDLGLETDIIKNYSELAEVKSIVKPKDGDVYTVGDSAPYSRYKAFVRGEKVEWEANGQTDLFVKGHAGNKGVFSRQNNEVEDGVYYSVGSQAPFKLFGKISTWNKIGRYITGDWNVHNANPQVGEVWDFNGTLKLKTEDGWRTLNKKLPLKNIFTMDFEKNGDTIRLREGMELGTYEFYVVKEK